MNDKESYIELDEYKGNKIIRIFRNEDDQYPFSFGLRKAKLVVENIDDIKEFIKNQEEEEEEKQVSGKIV